MGRLWRFLVCVMWQTPFPIPLMDYRFFSLAALNPLSIKPRMNPLAVVPLDLKASSFNLSDGGT